MHLLNVSKIVGFECKLRKIITLCETKHSISAPKNWFSLFYDSAQNMEMKELVQVLKTFSWKKIVLLTGLNVTVKDAVFSGRMSAVSGEIVNTPSDSRNQ